MKNNGIVLITALWTLVILSLLSLSFAHQTKIEVKLASRYKKDIELRQLVKSAIRVTLKDLGSDTNDYDALNENWRTKQTKLEDSLGELIKDYAYQEIELECSIVDEESKLNINKASMESLLRLIGEDEEIASSIIDWRDQDDEPLTEGAENTYYQSLEEPYRCKDAPFDLIDELLYVRGMSSELFYGNEEENIPPLRESVTVWGDGKININTAPHEILLTIPGIREEIIESIIEKRRGADGDDGTEDDEPFEIMESLKEIPNMSTAEYKRFEGYCKLTSSYFTVEASASLKKTNLEKKVSVVVEREDNTFKILMWKEN